MSPAEAMYALPSSEGLSRKPHDWQSVNFSKMKLLVVMPVYNESATLRQMVHRVLAEPLEIELLCVDDGSKDGSGDILSELERQHTQLRVLLQPQNQGKGAALRRGIQETRGDFVIIQDADLEYNPAEYSSLLEPLLQRKGGRSVWLAVYGRRATPCSVLLAFGRQLATNASLQYANQLEPHRNGNLLQGIPARRDSVDPARGKPIRVRTGSHCKSGEEAPSCIRGWNQLFGTHIRGRQKDWVERRLPCSVVSAEVFDQGTGCIPTGTRARRAAQAICFGFLGSAARSQRTHIVRYATSSTLASNHH